MNKSPVDSVSPPSLSSPQLSLSRSLQPHYSSSASSSSSSLASLSGFSASQPVVVGVGAATVDNPIPVPDTDSRLSVAASVAPAHVNKLPSSSLKAPSSTQQQQQLLPKLASSKTSTTNEVNSSEQSKEELKLTAVLQSETTDRKADKELINGEELDKTGRLTPRNQPDFQPINIKEEHFGPDKDAASGKQLEKQPRERNLFTQRFQRSQIGGDLITTAKVVTGSSVENRLSSSDLKLDSEPEKAVTVATKTRETTTARESIYSNNYNNDQGLQDAYYRPKGASRSIYPFYPNYKNPGSPLYPEYQHSDTSEEPQSDYIISSGGGTALNMLGTCSLTHTTRSFSLSGQSCIITPQVLQAQDAESLDLDLLYVVKEVTSGSVVLAEGRASRQVVTNFTQRQINNGDVVFQHQYATG